MDEFNALFEHENITVASLGVAVPGWLDPELNCHTFGAILEGGYPVGAILTPVPYYEADKIRARQIMALHGDAVMEYLLDAYETFDEIPPPTGHLWSGLAFHYLGLAIERWAQQVAPELVNALSAQEQPA